MPGLEAGEVGLPRVADSTGQSNGHVGSEQLEVGVDVAAFRRERDREHVRVADADPDQVKSASVTARADLPPGSVGRTAHSRQRWREPDDIVAHAHDHPFDRDREVAGGQSTTADGHTYVGAFEPLRLAPPPALREAGSQFFSAWISAPSNAHRSPPIDA
jgi:hypothetical protein